jgi:hypothetical protein
VICGARIMAPRIAAPCRSIPCELVKLAGLAAAAKIINIQFVAPLIQSVHV